MTEHERATAELLSVLDDLGRLAQVHDRPELAESAAAARRRLTSAVFRVALVGEFKKGKTSLVNGLLNAHAGVVDDDLATAAPMEICFADPPRAHVWQVDPGGTGTTTDAEIPPGEAAAASVEGTTVRVRLGLPRPLLETGLVLVDTPGVGGIGSAAAVATASTLSDAHAVIFVTDTSQELTAAELDALADAARRTTRLVVVETKIDLHPHWRTIVDADAEHLASRGIDVPILAVSNHLRHLALARGDHDLNRESGFPDLVKSIRASMIASARSIMIDDAAAAARRIHAHLRHPLGRELEALSEGAGPDPQVLATARREVAELRERAGSWAQILSDGMVDLTGQVDLHLRDGFRTLVAEAEATIDDADPDQIWDELEPALHRRVAELLDQNLMDLRTGATDLAARLAEAIHDRDFDPAAGAGVLVSIDESSGAVASPALDRSPAAERSAGARVQQAFRAGYGGAMPIMVVGGMALGVVGMGTLVMPLAGVAGATAGRRAFRDERERSLRQRRHQAKVAVKQYVDDVAFRAGNEHKAAGRRVQRGLRDHFGARAKEIARTHQQVLQRAEAAADAGEQERRRRIAALHQEIARLDAVLVSPTGDDR